MPTLAQVQDKIAHLVQIVRSASPLAYSSVGIGVLIAAIYFKIVFGDFQGFRESLAAVSKWQFWGSLNWEVLKFVIWVLLSVGAGFLAYHQLPVMFPKSFH